MNQCLECGRTYVYSKELRKKGYRTKLCNSCSIRTWRKRRKLKCIEYMGGSCEKCGYDKSPAALEFHHRDPNTKDFGMSEGENRSWDKTMVELDKCIMVCANCHREIHEEIVLEERKKRLL
jgi:hypothetical protein